MLHSEFANSAHWRTRRAGDPKEPRPPRGQKARSESPAGRRKRGAHRYPLRAADLHSEQLDKARNLCRYFFSLIGDPANAEKNNIFIVLFFNASSASCHGSKNRRPTHKTNSHTVRTARAMTPGDKKGTQISEILKK